MPKRYGYLYEKIYSWDNLLKAFYKSRTGKQDKKEVLEFEYNLENNLVEIQKSLKNKQFKFSGYKYFKIHKPKERLISCAPFKDRVVHHAICNILEPLLDNSMISDTYACRKGKGLHHAIKRAFYFYQNTDYTYKLDIKKYFYTIDHKMLLKKVERKIKDPNLIELIKKLLRTYKTKSNFYFPFDDDTLFEYGRARGLPIGNLTSQLLANYYLSEFDHFMKERQQCRNYIRYMDDILIFSKNRQNLRRLKKLSRTKLAQYRLKINPNKNQICKNKHGVNLLGFRFINNQIRLQNSNLVRFKRKLKKFSNKRVKLEKLLLSFNGHLGYFNSGHCKRIVSDILDEYEFYDGKKRFKLAL